MDFLVSASTDAGLVKENNQDSLMVKILSIDGQDAALAVLCDGVGGLSKGELASATVIKAFDRWFVERFPQIVYADDLHAALVSDWNKLLYIYNQKIRDYGQAQHLTLGTTVTALLLWNNRYYAINVGDSRSYEIKDELRQITRDQTIVNYELENGMITKEQAETDSRKNILLQCVGASETLLPDHFVGEVTTGTAFLLCSDGFRHVITNDEILERFHPSVIDSVETMKRGELELIELNKARMEKDNISVITIKVC